MPIARLAGEVMSSFLRVWSQSARRIEIQFRAARLQTCRRTFASSAHVMLDHASVRGPSDSRVEQRIAGLGALDFTRLVSVAPSCSHLRLVVDLARTRGFHGTRVERSSSSIVGTAQLSELQMFCANCSLCSRTRLRLFEFFEQGFRPRGGPAFSNATAFLCYADVRVPLDPAADSGDESANSLSFSCRAGHKTSVVVRPEALSRSRATANASAQRARLPVGFSGSANTYSALPLLERFSSSSMIHSV